MPRKLTPLTHPANLFNADEQVFIVGDGKSAKTLTEAQVGKLRARKVIAINDSVRVFPAAVAMVTVDAGWWQRHSGVKFSGLRVVAVERWDCGQRGAWYPPAEALVYGRASGGLSQVADKLCGGFSGHAAIDFAFHAGARRIVLVGFDGYANVPDVAGGPAFSRYESQLEELGRDAEGAGLEIVNASAASSLTCFKTIALDEALT